MNITQACLHGCLKRNRAAQKELYDNLLPYLNSICGRYLTNTSLRGDILQESFITIFNKIEQFDPNLGAIHSWASRIVINNCLKQNEKEKKIFEFQINIHDSPIEPKIIADLNQKDLEEFLKKMPKKYYEVFMLFILDGFSHDEIAEMLGMKVELSRKRLARARAWIQSNITE
jgi:RNA polymerase sigma-70 factor (ECF subfamily)